MRWSSLPLELFRKDRSVCVCIIFVYMCVEQGCRVSTVGGGAISLCFLLWDIINCSISSAQCNPVLFLLSLLQFLHIWPNCCLLDCLLFARFFFLPLPLSPSSLLSLKSSLQWKLWTDDEYSRYFRKMWQSFGIWRAIIDTWLLNSLHLSYYLRFQSKDWSKVVKHETSLFPYWVERG